MSSEQRAIDLVRNFLASKGRRDAHLKHEAKTLAETVHRGGVDLCMDRATEFSPRIGELFTLAAQLALIAYGAGSDKVDAYKKDLPKSDESVRAFDHTAALLRSG